MKGLLAQKATTISKPCSVIPWTLRARRQTLRATRWRTSQIISLDWRYDLCASRMCFQLLKRMASGEFGTWNCLENESTRRGSDYRSRKSPLALATQIDLALTVTTHHRTVTALEHPHVSFVGELREKETRVYSVSKAWLGRSI